MRGYDEFMCAAQKLKLSDVVEICDKDFSSERFLEDVKRLTASGVTALFIIHQHLAFKTVQLLKSQGYKIPEDLSVVTYMNEDISEFCEPPITTLDFNYDEIGKKACDIMAMRLQNLPCPVQAIRIPCPPLMIRESTGPV